MRKVPPPFLIGGANSPTSSGGAGSKGEVNPCSPPPPFAGVRAQHMCEARLAPSNCPPARKSLGALGEGGQGAEKAHKDSSKTRDRIAFGVLASSKDAPTCRLLMEFEVRCHGLAAPSHPWSQAH
ncbi:uncharacterized protein LOC143652277 isoform X2 [Tamandua tetradactyla]|uniref:uncharacterized protein LOC143652277 isoform X2 n=1 Tax=Tamandua tetradactyla TaxID=48850 RepID=UPI00405394B0